MSSSPSLRTVLAEAAEAIDALFQPAHLDGCLFKADRRMPCQCGSWERERAAVARVKDAATRLRQVEQVLGTVPQPLNPLVRAADETLGDWQEREAKHAAECVEFVSRLRSILHPADATEGDGHA